MLTRAQSLNMYCKARSTHCIPYSVKSKVKEELNRLVAEGTLEPVQTSEWASLIVPVIKPDKSIHICGNLNKPSTQSQSLTSIQFLKWKICL